ncbi:MAG TPA: corrinoid protein [Chitinivibrionales bacterium]|nr:corrinoid protein [Chitinivibrionales bacterium]
MPDILSQIATCVEKGKISAAAPFPPDMKGKDGADELTGLALTQGIPPQEVLSKGLVPGMYNVGEKFRLNKVFIPDVLMAAKAMYAGMKHLKPYFLSGAVKRRGTFVIGTAAGDLHDIGKNLVAMIVEGGGWEVVDLGVDVSIDKFVKAAGEHPGCSVGISTLLTTTMMNMEKTTRELKEKFPGIRVIVGGAPLTREFADKIGAAYSADPQGAVDFLNSGK